MFIYVSKKKKHKYEGIHGIYILVKAHLAINCHIIDILSSESILWLHVNNKMLRYDCIICAVYIPHEMSDYYHDDIYDFIADDIVYIKLTFDIPIILLGDFNSGIATDFEHLYEHECPFLKKTNLLRISNNIILLKELTEITISTKMEKKT